MWNSNVSPKIIGFAMAGSFRFEIANFSMAHLSVPWVELWLFVKFADADFSHRGAIVRKQLYLWFGLTLNTRAMVIYDLESIALFVWLANGYDQAAEGSMWRGFPEITTCQVCWHSVFLYDLDWFLKLFTMPVLKTSEQQPTLRSQNSIPSLSVRGF